MSKKLTAREIAGRFNVNKRIVLGWIERGLFPNAVKIKSPLGIEFWTVPERDLLNFVPQRRRGRPARLSQKRT